MGVNLAAAGGGINDDIIAFYEARARGGTGLIISGICRVMDGEGAGEACQIAARNTADLQGLGRLVDTVHKYDTRLFLQLHHPGRNYGLGSEQPVSASPVTTLFHCKTPRALTVPEIETMAFCLRISINEPTNMETVLKTVCGFYSKSCQASETGAERIFPLESAFRLMNSLDSMGTTLQHHAGSHQSLNLRV